DSFGVVDATTHPGYDEAITEFGLARSFEGLAKAGPRIGGDVALVARYRAGGAYHPWHPFWLFAEDEYAMTRARAIIVAGGPARGVLARARGGGGGAPGECPRAPRPGGGHGAAEPR